MTGLARLSGESFSGTVHSGSAKVIAPKSLYAMRKPSSGGELSVRCRSSFGSVNLKAGRRYASSFWYLSELPGMRIGTHYRWLRLVIQQALNAVERKPVPRGKWPVRSSQDNVELMT